MARRKKSKNSFDLFFREGRAVGLPEVQIDFIWDWLYLACVAPEVFTHDDNYALPTPEKGKKKTNG